MSNNPRPDAGAARWPFVAAGCLIVAAGLLMNELVLGSVLTERGRITNPSSRLALAFFDVVMIAVGAVLIVRRERTPWRQMLVSVAATLFALLIAEGGLRIWSAAVPRDRELAAGLGWRPVANLTLDSEVPGFGRVRYHTVEKGFRLYGDPATTKIKVLVLGDSFTEAAMVSDGETYYERLAAARPDLEMFAIGGGGRCCRRRARHGAAGRLALERPRARNRGRGTASVAQRGYSTVTLFARFLGWSTSQPR